MELKKVSSVEVKRYAKKNEISKKEMKKFTPQKWLLASATGIVTLMYASPKNSIHQIGVVFGCIQMMDPGEVYHTAIWKITNSAMELFYGMAWVLGITFIGFFIEYIINVKKYEEEEKRKTKAVKTIKIIATILIACIIITSILDFLLKMDLDIFHFNTTNGVEMTNSEDFNNEITDNLTNDGI